MASFTRLIAIASLLVAMQDVNADPPETNYIPIQLLTVEQLNQIANVNWRNNFGDESLPIQCDDASFKTDEVGKIVSMKVSTLPWIVSLPPSVQKDIERDIDKQIRKKNPEQPEPHLLNKGFGDTWRWSSGVRVKLPAGFVVN